VNDRYNAPMPTLNGVADDAGFALPPPIDDEQAWRAWADALPASRNMGLICTQARADGVVTEMARSPWALNPNGSVFGGLVMAAVDQTLGLAAMAAKFPDGITATASLTYNFTRPAILPLTLAAEVVRVGRTLVSLTGTVRDGQDRVCGTAVGTWSATESARGVMQ
jgi:uncharacterized protein (TIGR00369 family)